MENQIQKIEKVEDKTLASYLDVMGISTKLNENEKAKFCWYLDVKEHENIRLSQL
jgi:hypothetical protein